MVALLSRSRGAAGSPELIRCVGNNSLVQRPLQLM